SAVAVASFLLFTPGYPDSVAASIGAVRDALLLADHAPRSSDPVLRLSRILADLGFRARGASAKGSLLGICESVGSELALTDTDISERYFGGVAPAERLMTA
ncbi:MAG TPA: alpha-E domain-containing protein, partial [Solirubrobacteraceae bacterium]